MKQSDSLLEKLLKEDDDNDSVLCNTTQDSVLSPSVLDGLIEDDEGEQQADTVSRRELELLTN